MYVRACLRARVCVCVSGKKCVSREIQRQIPNAFGMRLKAAAVVVFCLFLLPPAASLRRGRKKTKINSLSIARVRGRT